MWEIFSSIILFALFAFYFYTYIPFGLSKRVCIILSFICALPAFKMNSVLFIFEVHFIILSFSIHQISKHLFKWKLKPKSEMFCMIPVSFILSSMFVLYGIWNMDQIVRTEYTIETTKPISKDLTITLISDLHYPTATNIHELNALIKRISNEQSDIIVLNGDIVDENTSISERIEVFLQIEKLSKESQVYYVYGNHDLGKHFLTNQISQSAFNDLIESCGIQVLNDEVIEIEENITVVGRADHNTKTRKSVSKMLSKVNQDDFIVVLDHQPKDLKEISNYDVDLHLSGHTHAGQIFPLYYVYELFGINEMNYGLEKYNQMSAINTSGAAGWGFPVRTQKHSEYVVVKIKRSE